jgi:hypothetical protein
MTIHGTATRTHIIYHAQGLQNEATKRRTQRPISTSISFWPARAASNRGLHKENNPYASKRGSILMSGTPQ